MNKKYNLGKENRETIKLVANQIGGIIGKTLGPGGRNYLLNSGITNDGKTIVRSIRFKDECQDLVSLIVCDIADMADKDGGDGTSTALVVGTTLVADLIDKVEDLDVPINSSSSMSVIAMVKKLKEEKEIILDLLEKEAVKVETLEQLEDVAITAMEDDVIAKRVARAVWEVGPDGFVTMEEGFGGDVEIENVPGIKYAVGVVAPFQYTTSKNEAIFTDSPILVANHFFTSLSELNPLLKEFNTMKRFSSFIIVAKGFEPPFIRSVHDLAVVSNFKILLLKTSITDDELEDVASFVDAKVINTSPRIGNKTEDIKFHDLGNSKKIIAGEKETVFIGGRGLESAVMTTAGSVVRVTDRVRSLKELMGDKKDEKLEGRIARLSGGIAIIRFDAKTQTEKYYLKLKIEDTKNSCRGALKYGMVPGGGVTLSKIADSLGQDALMYKALKEPYLIIQRNYGGQLDIGEGVVDSLNVARSSISNPISVASKLITQEGIIADEEMSMIEEFKNKLF